MVKGFRQIALLTVASRILGLLRDMAYSYFLGAGGLFDAWTIAFKIPNLARRIFGEGAASSSFIPVYSQQLETNRDSAKKLACTVVTVVFVILAATVLIGELCIWSYYKFFSVYERTQLTLALTGIMLPYMVLICVIAIIAGILNVHKHFATPAAAPIVLNIFIIGSLCLSGWVLKIEPRTQVFFIAVAVLIAGVIQLLMQLPVLRSKGITIKPAWQVHSDEFKKIMILMGPMILGLTVTQINTLADDLIAWSLSGSPEKGTLCQLSFFAHQLSFKYPLWEGAVSRLYYSQRLYQFPLGVLGISLATAIFPVMSAHAAKKDFDGLIKTINKGIKGTIFIALPATAGLFLVAGPLVTAVFQRGQFTAEDTQATAWTLLFYSIGLCGFFSQQILARAFFSIQDSKTPMRSAIIAVLINIILNLSLIWHMGTAGLALSTAICSYLQVAILIFVLCKRFNLSILDGLKTLLAKTFIATIIMLLAGILALKLMKNLQNDTLFSTIRLGVVVPLSAGVYTLSAKLMRIESLTLLTGSKQTKK